MVKTYYNGCRNISIEEWIQADGREGYLVLWKKEGKVREVS